MSIPFLALAAQAIASSEVLKNPAAVAALRKATDALKDVTDQKEKELKDALEKEKKKEEQKQRFELSAATIGRRIEQVRKLKNLTQEEFSESCGISRTALRNIEQGQDSKLSSLYAISEALEIPLTAILKDTQEEVEKKFTETTSSQGT